MALFRLTSRLLRVASVISRETERTLEEVVQNALKKGLEQMQNGFISQETPKKKATIVDEKNAEFIRENWQNLSDEEMGDKLGLAKMTIRYYRLTFNLKRKRGRKILKPVVDPSLLTDEEVSFINNNLAELNYKEMAESLQKPPALVKAARQKAEECFIRTNYQKMSDGEIGRALKCSRASVFNKRLKLRLYRPKGYGGVRKQIDENDLRIALTNGGFTRKSYIREHGLDITPERLRQICDELGIEKTRTPLWHANKMGEPLLADKDWLTEKLQKLGNAKAVAERITEENHRRGEKNIISPQMITNQACRLGINVGFLKGHGQLVEKVCSFCHKPFLRKKIEFRNLNQKVFFCNRICHGKWLGGKYGFKKRKRQRSRSGK